MRSINIYSVDTKSNLEFPPFQRAPGQISWSEPQWSIYLNSPVTYAPPPLDIVLDISFPPLYHLFFKLSK